MAVILSLKLIISQRKTTKSSSDILYANLAKTDSTEQIIAKTGHLFTTAIQDSIALLDAATIDLLAEKMISAKRIVLFGVGASAIVASDIFHKLIRVNKTPYLVQISMRNLLIQRIYPRMIWLLLLLQEVILRILIEC